MKKKKEWHDDYVMLFYLFLLLLFYCKVHFPPSQAWKLTLTPLFNKLSSKHQHNNFCHTHWVWQREGMFLENFIFWIHLSFSEFIFHFISFIFSFSEFIFHFLILYFHISFCFHFIPFKYISFCEVDSNQYRVNLFPLTEQTDTTCVLFRWCI